RDEAYIGVLVDDLITMGTVEPYRMFTSRAEYRLLLREDNADLRLTEQGRALGLVDDARWRRFEQKCVAIHSESERLGSTWVHPGTPEARALEGKLKNPISREYSLAELLKRPEVEYADVAGLKGEPSTDTQAAEQVAIQAKYAGYIDRQQEEIERLRRYENTPLPTDLDYQAVDGLSNEVRQKLSEARPETLARAGRTPGVTAAAISLLLIYLKKRGALVRPGQDGSTANSQRKLA
ncbi:MAG: tRNA uridine-5-carboxymethylaminomethyl(34) synthesis enzyme MnmG, partial [Gammaproteobacteria bacterium]